MAAAEAGAAVEVASEEVAAGHAWAAVAVEWLGHRRPSAGPPRSVRQRGQVAARPGRRRAGLDRAEQVRELVAVLVRAVREQALAAARGRVAESVAALQVVHRLPDLLRALVPERSILDALAELARDRESVSCPADRVPAEDVFLVRAVELAKCQRRVQAVQAALVQELVALLASVCVPAKVRASANCLQAGPVAAWQPQPAAVR